jgi:hypothetical protein
MNTAEKIFERKRAFETGKEYFDNLESSLKDALANVRRSKKYWKLAMNDKTDKEGYKPDNDLKILEINHCVHNIANNLHTHESTAIRAVAQIARVYNVNV